MNDSRLLDRVGVEDSHDGFRPYAHQNAAWNGMDKRYGPESDDKNGILIVPTGGGKTTIAARWLLRNRIAREGRVLWVTHRRGLLAQAFHTFRNAAHLAQGRRDVRLRAVSSQDFAWSQVEPADDVVFSTVQSASTQANLRFIDQMVAQSPKGLFVVVDEAHHASSPSYQRLLKLISEKDCELLGLTATPVRLNQDDERRMWRMFKNIVYEIKLKTLIEQGILSTPKFETVQTQIEFEREFTESDFKDLAKWGDLGQNTLQKIAASSGRNQLIVQHYLKSRERYGKTLVFAIDVFHAKTLHTEFKGSGVSSDYVDYTRADSPAVMDAFKSPTGPDVLINVDMLTEGYDAPKTETVFLTRPSRSESLLSQMIGRALRGPKADGTENANLVTFVDTWKEFHPLDVEFLVDTGEAQQVETKSHVTPLIVPIPMELISEAYRLVRSVSKGFFTGLYECLPHSWFTWEQEFENEIQRVQILVFENQVEAFDALIADHADPSTIPVDMSEAQARDLVTRYFGDCPDPHPRWTEIRALLNAKREGLEVNRYTFAEKEAFNPTKLAKEIIEADFGEKAKREFLRKIYDENAVCGMVYHGDFETFREDVQRQVDRFLKGSESSPSEIKSLPVERRKLRPFPPGERGVNLGELLDAVWSEPRHFPKGRPAVKDLRFSNKPMSKYWGLFRYDTRAIVINAGLNSPDVPRFVLEYLLYHEALHADMPNSGHDKNFRERERYFQPSAHAKEEARALNLGIGTSDFAWSALADQFLDTTDIPGRQAWMDK